ncbi:hypothetical protein V8E54_004951 [Elaphomyces granulatus]
MLHLHPNGMLHATPREQDDSIEINESTKEFHCAVDLTNKGGILSTRGLKELKARTKAREEMVELEKRIRTIENAETPRSPEGTTEPTDQQQKTASPVVPSSPSSLSSSSDSDSESNSSDPCTYGKGRQKILKALDFVDQPLVTLWYTYRDRKEKRKSHKMKRWTKERFKEVKTPPQTCIVPPYHFGFFLSSIERDLPEKDDEDLAFAFYSKLSSELKRQFQTAHIKVPKSRAKCAAVAQEIWEALHPEYRKSKEHKQRNQFWKDSKEKDKDSNTKDKRHWHTRGNSQQRESKRFRKDMYNLSHRRNSSRDQDKGGGKKKKLNDDTFKKRVKRNVEAVTKSTAKALRIWEFVDPDLDAEPILPNTPTKPSVSAIKADATTIADLKGDELTKYGFLRDDWKEEKAVYEKIESGLTAFRNHFHATVNADKIGRLTKTENSLYKIMKSLKKDYPMSDKSRRNNALKRYGNLKRFPNDRDLEIWCDEWTKIYDDFKEAKVIEINSIKHDFYETNKKVDPLFTAAYTLDYATFGFEDLVNEFKENYKSSPPQKHQFPRTSFAATLHGHSQEKERRLTAALSPAFNTLVGANAPTSSLQFGQPTGPKTPISRTREEPASFQIQGSTTTGIQPTCTTICTTPNPDPVWTTPPLRNPNIAMVSAFVGAMVTDCASFIADNGSDSHIVNRFYRDRLMTNVRPGNGIQVRHGPDLTPVELVGDAYYDAYDGYGRLNRFTITGVLYVPDFITNIVMRLTKEQYEDPSTLSSNSFAAIKRNTTPRSTLPIQDASNLETWRRRFGYISDTATRQLLDVATGIEITDLKAPPHPKGEPIPLTQAHELAAPKRQISRRPQDDPSQSGGPQIFQCGQGRSCALGGDNNYLLRPRVRLRQNVWSDIYIVRSPANSQNHELRWSKHGWITTGYALLGQLQLQPGQSEGD